MTEMRASANPWEGAQARRRRPDRARLVFQKRQRLAGLLHQEAALGVRAGALRPIAQVDEQAAILRGDLRGRARLALIRPDESAERARPDGVLGVAVPGRL